MTWVDSTRMPSTVAWINRTKRVTVLGYQGDSLTVNDQMMATGFDLSKGQLVVSGVPYKTYDVICYLSGNAGLAAPQAALVPVDYVDDNADQTAAPGKKKKKKGKKNKKKRPSHNPLPCPLMVKN